MPLLISNRIGPFSPSAHNNSFPGIYLPDNHSKKPSRFSLLSGWIAGTCAITPSFDRKIRRDNLGVRAKGENTCYFPRG